MTRGIFTVGAFVSSILFPWPFTAILALFAARTVPFAPFAVGVFVDALYYPPGAFTVPWGSVLGAIATCTTFALKAMIRK